MRVDENHRRTVLVALHFEPAVRADMHALAKRLGNDLPTGRAALRRLELARVAQMQPCASFFRFVREYPMRHAERGRENFPVESSLLPHSPPWCLHRAASAAAHVLWGQFFRSDHRARPNEFRDFLMYKLPAQVGDPLMQASQAAAQSLVAHRPPVLACALALQRGKAGQFFAQPARVRYGLSIVECRPIIDAEVEHLGAWSQCAAARRPG